MGGNLKAQKLPDSVLMGVCAVIRRIQDAFQTLTLAMLWANSADDKWMINFLFIMKTCLFKYTENFTTKT